MAEFMLLCFLTVQIAYGMVGASHTALQEARPCNEVEAEDWLQKHESSEAALLTLLAEEGEETAAQADGAGAGSGKGRKHGVHDGETSLIDRRRLLGRQKGRIRFRNEESSFGRIEGGVMDITVREKKAGKFGVPGRKVTPSWMPDYTKTPVPRKFSTEAGLVCDVPNQNADQNTLSCLHTQGFKWTGSMEATRCSDYSTTPHKMLPAGDGDALSYCLDRAVPLQYISWAEYDFMKPVTPLKERNGRGVVFVSNCVQHRKNKLEAIVRALKKVGLQVDGYGACKIAGTNRERKCPRGTCYKVDRLAEYSFYLGLENTQTWDYVTEKVLQGFVAGVITLAWGPENVEMFSPSPDAVINLHTWGDRYDSLAAHLKKLMEAPIEGHRWKETGPSDQFLALGTVLFHY
jgi:hypothetical protein